MGFSNIDPFRLLLTLEANSIKLYIKSLTHFRKLMHAARSVFRVKPIIVPKPGRSPTGAEVAASAVSTGDFAPHDVSLEAFGWLAQVWITLICLAGAIPLAFYYRMFKEKQLLPWKISG